MAPSSERHAGLAACLTAWRVVPVLRTDAGEQLRRAAHEVAGHGWGVVELTATSPGWPQVLASLRLARPELAVGVGTLRDVAEVREAADGGAAFLVTPGYRPDLVSAANDLPFVAGAATPTEIELVRRQVGEIVKIFPATQLGGPAFVRAIAAVYPEAQLVPTGGIRLPDVPAYLDAGAAAVGVGGSAWFQPDDVPDLLSHMHQLRPHQGAHSP